LFAVVLLCLLSNAGAAWGTAAGDDGNTSMSEDEFDSAEDDLADKSVFVQSEVRRPT
jgi:hypothetical protein